jgi:pimeloyl-ACP methyl ester carboxylesterase
MPGAARLVLLPGMGADARLFGPLRARLPDLEVPRWLPPAGSLADYARAYVDAGIVSADDVVGGSSFGGFVASEIATLIRPRGLVLLGSATSPAGISSFVRALAPLGGRLPLVAIRHAPATPIALAFAIARPSHRRACAAMLADASPAFLRWACAAMATWRGAEPRCPILRIHGDVDHIVRVPRRAMPRPVMVPGAGHLACLTHASRTAAAIRSFRLRVERLGD